MNPKIAPLALAVAAAIAAPAHASTSTNTAKNHARIIGGEQSTPNTYSWMVSVQSKDGQHFCGGSLIADKYVMTAAHCLEDTNADDIQLVINDYDISQPDASEEKLSVAKIVSHDDWDDSMDNDIAVLELASPSSKTPVRLATQEEMKALPTGSTLTVMGWGNRSNSGEDFPDLLHEVSVPLADQSTCKDNYDDIGQDITNNMLCAGLAEGGKDSCQGDSGGPLLFQKDSEWIQAGIVSFGEGCAERDYVGVYTNVSRYLAWIEEAKVAEGNDEYDDEDENDAELPLCEDDYDEEYGDDEYYEEDEPEFYNEYEDDEFDEEIKGWEEDDSDYEDIEACEGPDYEDEGEYEEEDDENTYASRYGLPLIMELWAFEGQGKEKVELYNFSDTAATINDLRIDGSQFAIAGNQCPSTLTFDESCLFNVTFNPQDSQTAIGKLSAVINNEIYETALVGLNLNVLADQMDDMDWYFEGEEWEHEEDDFEFDCDVIEEGDDGLLASTVEGPGVLSFELSVVNDSPENTFEFMVNGVVVKTVASNSRSTKHTVQISEGSHKVAWRYRKNAPTTQARAKVSNVDFQRSSGSGSSPAGSDSQAPASGGGSGGSFGVFSLAALLMMLGLRRKS